MTSSWHKKAGWITLGIALVLAWPVWQHLHARHAVNSYLKELRAKGEKLTIAEAGPQNPTNGFNGAPALQAAAVSVARVGEDLRFVTMKHIVPGKARVAWQQPVLPQAVLVGPNATRNTNIWPDLKALFEQYRSTIPGLQAALEAPWLDFNLDYSQGAMLLLPHVVNMKATVTFLCNFAILDFHEKNGSEAKKNLAAAVRLSSLYATEPIMISQLIDQAMVRLAFAATWEALHYPDWKDSELAELQKHWENFSILQNAENALAMERAMGRVNMEHLRAASLTFGSGNAGGTGGNSWSSFFSHDSQEEDMPSFNKVITRAVAPLAWRWWWSYDQELIGMHVCQASVEALRKISREQNALQTLQVLRPEITQWENRMQQHSLKYPVAAGLDHYCEKTVAIEVRRQMMVTAIALKRFHLRNGKYPAQLSQLVPEFLPKLPVDLIDGQPLRYRLKDEQHFLLYSIGLDGKGNGGDPAEGPDEFNLDGKSTGRDWVYPEPATPEEIKAEEGKNLKKMGR